MKRCFLLLVHESWGAKEADAIYKAFAKVDAAYRK